MESREEPKEEPKVENQDNKPEYTAENPDPESNHEWYAQFDPKSSEYHGGGGTKFFSNPTNKIFLFP